MAPTPRGKLRRLVKRPGAIIGSPGELAEAPTFDEAALRKKWEERLK